MSGPGYPFNPFSVQLGLVTPSSNVVPFNPSASDLVTCWCCNVQFYPPVSTEASSMSIYDPQYSTYYLQSLNSLFDLDSPEPVHGELHPFCSNCLKLVAECCQLKQQSEQTSFDLCKSRSDVGMTIVSSFPSTSAQRLNYAVKRKIYEHWFAKVNALTNDVATSMLQKGASSTSQLQSQQNSQSTSPAASSVRSYSPDPNNEDFPAEFVEVYDDDPPSSSDSYESVESQPKRRSGRGRPKKSVTKIKIPRRRSKSSSIKSPKPKTTVKKNESKNIDTSGTLPNLYGDSNVRAVDETLAAVQSITTERPPVVHTVPVGPQYNSDINNPNVLSFPYPKAKTRERAFAPCTENGKKVYYCPSPGCEKKYNKNDSLKNHFRSHTGEVPYECCICGRPFTRRGTLKCHYELHNPDRKEGEPTFKCPYCEKMFHFKPTMRNHVLSIHKGKKRVYDSEKIPVTCTICDAVLSGRRALANHMLSKHADEKRFECIECHKKFSAPYLLRHHLKFHYRCQICPDTPSLKTKIKFTEHMKTLHPEVDLEAILSEKPDKKPLLLCHFCSHPCYGQLSLNKHVSNYHEPDGKFYGEEPPKPKKRKYDIFGNRKKATQKCLVCESEQPSSNALRLHMKEIHPEEKPYRCGLCECSFRVLLALTSHMKKHFKCYFCPESPDLQTQERFEVHFQQMHPYADISAKEFLSMKWQQRLKLSASLTCSKPECSFKCDAKSKLAQHKKERHKKKTKGGTEPEATESNLDVNKLDVNEKDLDLSMNKDKEVDDKKVLIQKKRSSTRKTVRKKRKPKKSDTSSESESENEDDKDTTKNKDEKEKTKSKPKLQPIPCPVCKVYQADHKFLVGHMKLAHPTEKPFECDICHRRFTTSLFMTTHKSLHFKCQICKDKAPFQSKEKLEKHVKKFHKGSLNDNSNDEKKVMPRRSSRSSKKSTEKKKVAFKPKTKSRSSARKPSQKLSSKVNTRGTSNVARKSTGSISRSMTVGQSNLYDSFSLPQRTESDDDFVQPYNLVEEIDIKPSVDDIILSATETIDALED